jgi:hypothetical protein
MTTQSPAPTDLLEQAHLALMRGHLAQARSLLEQLIIAEPDNAEAQDLRATVIAQQAVLSETALFQASVFPSAAPPVQTGSVWTRPVPDPVAALLNTSSSMKKPSKLLLNFLAFAVFALVVLMARVWPDPKNERVAEALVGSAYQTARSGGEQQYRHHSWEAIESQYGRVLSWHILGEHQSPLLGDWAFDVEVTRERALTRERVEASAGASRSYGYRSSISSVEVESAAVRSQPL